MAALVAVLAIVLILFVLWDAFETILLPRRIPSGLRISRLVLRALWSVWSTIGSGIKTRNQRENFLSLYALLSLIGLLVVWAGGLILAFAALNWSFGSHMVTSGGPVGFRTDLYMSGTTFFTLGLGDVVPGSPMSRLLTVIEAGMGFGFLALVLAYLPVLYQAFSRREARITMLDEWAGSPPTAAVLVRRCFESRDPGAALNALLKDWEIAAAEILESHLSYPILAFFRSQHDNQSWIAALSTVLDTCALVISGVDDIDPFQARLTFAICRHTLVDVTQTIARRQGPVTFDQPPMEGLAEARAWLLNAKVPIADDPEAEKRLADLRAMYTPFIGVLSVLLLMPLPPLMPPVKARYNWETTVWAKTGRDDAH
ncbi:MAG TPA: potassium channel family protein [Candidatus Saccharimonadaceae bacterium]|jgi:hypothetical protein|nr:potassium channel family protein [Candidatus Saccharimonadaceae bacterium]